MSALGRETVFTANLAPQFISPIPHQKKRPISQIEFCSKATLNVLDSKPQEEFLSEKPLMPIYRNTFESHTKVNVPPKKTIVLDMLAESSVLEQKNSNIRFFEKKTNLESQSSVTNNKNTLKYSPQKLKRVDKIMNSDLMRQTLGEWKGEKVIKEKNEGKNVQGFGVGAGAGVGAKKTADNKQRSCYRFKVSSDEKGYFYVD